MGGQLRAGSRGTGAPAHALDQAQTETALQLPHLLAHGGLRQPVAFSGQRKTSLLHDIEQNAQMIQVKAGGFHGIQNIFLYE
ncbi:hypothetical protein D557_0316 [Bordetella holmesii 70147]|nr:hypothetical protein D557_0316 [Bordetella holmesii 70147]